MEIRKLLSIVILTGTLIVYFTPVSDVLADGNGQGEDSGTEYTIKKGDTLWDISKEYLKNPFLWPNIWGENSYIKNPDLIYPENKLVIPLVIPIPPPKEEVIAPAAEAVTPTPVTIFTPDAPVTVSAPSIPPSPLQPPVAPEPAAAKSVISPDIIESVGYIIDKTESYGVIRGSLEGRNIFANGDAVNLSLLKEYSDKVSIGDKLTIFRTSGPLKHPETGKKIGMLFIPVGVLEINRVQGGDASGKIVKSYGYASPGDQIQPYTTAVSVTAAKGSAAGIKGYIIESHEGKTLNAQYSVVYIDRGASDGITPGILFYVVSGRRNDVIGELRVISVQDTTSTALVIKSIEPFGVGSKVVAAVK